jgi:hypothetical protein
VRPELTIIVLVLAAATLVACSEDPIVVAPATSTGSGGSSSSIGGTGGIPMGTPISAKATVKFKSKDRLLKDFQNALSLSDAELCMEVGTIKCGDVHSVALAGTDAYDAGVYEPLAESAATTAIAVDRIGLSACQTRAHLDFKDLGSAVIFKLDVTGSKLDDVNDAKVEGVITDLYNRIHLREAKLAEVAHLRQLYTDIEYAGSTAAAKDRASLSCYAVITTMESVFY